MVPFPDLRCEVRSSTWREGAPWTAGVGGGHVDTGPVGNLPTPSLVCTGSELFVPLVMGEPLQENLSSLKQTVGCFMTSVLSKHKRHRPRKEAAALSDVAPEIWFWFPKVSVCFSPVPGFLETTGTTCAFSGRPTSLGGWVRAIKLESTSDNSWALFMTSNPPSC